MQLITRMQGWFKHETRASEPPGPRRNKNEVDRMGKNKCAVVVIRMITL